MSSSPPLFTARFLTMCGFSFTLFLSAFQLFPTAPFRIVDLGGSTLTAGLFLGLLTYASAFSAPFTGALADRIGRRRQLLGCSLVITGLAGGYAAASRPNALLVLAVVHGLFWSGLLSANAAYTTELIPPERRAEGIGYHGLANVLAIALAPTLGLWVYRGGWLVLCLSIGALDLLMAFIAYRLPDDRPSSDGSDHAGGARIQWRVTAAAITLFLVALGYGAVISFVALMADRAGLRPKAWYFIVLAIAMIASRPFMGRLADRVGAARVLLPCLALAAVGYAALALPPSVLTFSLSAVLVGGGFGSAYPIFAAWTLRHVPAGSRGATFGGILAAMDTGIGTGSILVGWTATWWTFEAAFGVTALCAALSVPYFHWIGSRALPQGSGVVESVAV